MERISLKYEVLLFACWEQKESFSLILIAHPRNKGKIFIPEGKQLKQIPPSLYSYTNTGELTLQMAAAAASFWLSQASLGTQQLCAAPKSNSAATSPSQNSRPQ